MDYTRVIYQNPKIFVDLSDDKNYKVIAKDKIEPCEVLLIEHILSCDANTIQDIVYTDKQFFDTLHPRSNVCGDRKSEAFKKFDSNVFVDSDQKCSLGLVSSLFNHSCLSNATQHSYEYKDVAAFFYFFAIRDIKAGEEVTISYSIHHGHENKYYFSCSCTLTLQERESYYVDIFYNKFFAKINGMENFKVYPKIFQYIKDGKDVWVNQKLATHKIFQKDSPLTKKLEDEYDEKVNMKKLLIHYP